jgi:hypothetical protein
LTDRILNDNKSEPASLRSDHPVVTPAVMQPKQVAALTEIRNTNENANAISIIFAQH